MRFLWIILAVGCGCGKGADDKPAAGSAGPAPATKVVKCQSAEAAPALELARPVEHVAADTSTISLGQLKVDGELDGAIVRRYLTRNKAKLAACYAQQLPRKPKLAGTVSAKFTFSADGLVLDSTAQGVDVDVASCTANVIKQIEFPKPAKGKVTVTAPLVFTLPAAAPPPVVAPIVKPPAKPPTEWTPYAAREIPVAADAQALAFAPLLTSQLAQLDECFGARSGSLRVMVELGHDGKVGRVRVGGLGDRKGETCVMTKLFELRLPPAAYPEVPVEIACDLERGGALPWRVTPADDYAVVELTKAGVRRDPTRPFMPMKGPERLDDLVARTKADAAAGSAWDAARKARELQQLKAANDADLKPLADTLDGDHTNLIVVTDDVDPSVLGSVIEVAAAASTTLVAHKVDGAAELIGIAAHAAGAEAGHAPALALVVYDTLVVACLGDTPLGDGAPLENAEDLVALATDACATKHCARTAMLDSIAPKTIPQLVAIARSVQHAGFGVAFGRTGCERAR